MNRSSLSLLLLGVLVLGASCHAGGRRALRGLAEAEIRVAWVQDQGDGTDVFCRGTNLVLMGMATDTAPRRLLPAPGNYYKPLFTPDGKAVVVSDRAKRTIRRVSWDGGTSRSMGSGVAVEVWRDPDSGRTWVYALDGPNEPEGKWSRNPLVRFPLNAPDQREVVWDKTWVTWSNFQLSQDGTRAGALLPWPDAYWLEPATGAAQPAGRGCWTSLSPDNRYLLWIFQRDHRRVVVHAPGSEPYDLDVAAAPGMEGYEVYHPRWSNHPRLVTVTGPYREGRGDNRIRAGGRGVEVYVGRLNAAATRVEEWVRVTRNERGDFYPDVWVGQH